MVDKVIESFKRDFLAIKSKGFVPSSRKHDTGIGKTFEDLIGILENNNALADYKGLIELKSARELSGSMVTLFTKSPSSPKGVNAVLREKYGQPDKTSMKILHTTVSAVKFNTFAGKFGFKLDVDDAKNKIFLRVKDLQADKAEEMEIYCDFAQLKEKVENKCRYIAFITAQTKKEGGKEFFKFDNAQILSGMTFEKFLNAIKAGLIVYDLRLGAYKSGKNKGKLHDHGSGFRILKNSMHDVFEVSEI